MSDVSTREQSVLERRLRFHVRPFSQHCRAKVFPLPKRHSTRALDSLHLELLLSDDQLVSAAEQRQFKALKFAASARDQVLRGANRPACR